MQYWNDIIHTAMLGTSKKTPDSAALPAALQQGMVQLPATEPEETFLQIAALAYNFRQCSVAPAAAPVSSTAAAGPESLAYCSTQSIVLLTAILNIDSTSLLQLWLQACQQNGQIVQPDIVPQLLETAVKQKSLRTSIAACCGNRGQWLCQFNPAWNFGSTTTPEEIWQTGTLQQRVQVITQIRTEEPAKALEWLQATWPQETAATKEELLPILENNSSAADLPFLESLSAEKSKKVKDKAALMQQYIPESAIVQSYWQVLKTAIYLKKEKALLGLTTKTKLVVQLPENVDEAVYKSGIDKLSKNAKVISDEDYILQQLIGQVPPHWWEEHLGESKEHILEWFQKYDHAKLFMQALGYAATRFRDTAWLQAVIKFDKEEAHSYPAALPLLPAQEQEVYAAKLIAKGGDVHPVMYTLLSSAKEWSLPLTRQVMQHMQSDAWRYNAAFFNEHIHLIPAAIAPELNSFKPANEWQRNAWQNTANHIASLLQLKQEIFTVFKA